MKRKVKAYTVKTPNAKSNGRGTPYRSLAHAPPPCQRQAQFLKATAGDSAKAMTEDELKQWLSKFPNLWPDGTEIDEFVRWLRNARR